MPLPSVFALFPSSNWTLHAIPAYMIVAIIPRLYSQSIVKNNASQAKNSKGKEGSMSQKGLGGSPGRFSNKVFGPVWRPDAPNASDFNNEIRSVLPLREFQTYERAVAAHKNCMENAPLFLSTVIIANLPGVGLASTGPRGVQMANAFASAYLLTRAGYIWAYIFAGGEKAHFWPIRSIMYHTGVTMCFAVIWKVAERVRKASW